MRFKKEITIVVEGEIFDESTTPEEVLKSLKIQYSHWWENNPNWPYGTPSVPIQKGRIDKISLDGKELNILNEQNS